MAKVKAAAKAKTKTKAKAATTAKVKAPGPPTPPPGYFLGEIHIFGFNYPPANFAPCNGTLMPIMRNQALFSLLGTTYGGNGVSTFALPTLAPVKPGGPFYFICINGTFPTR